MWLMGKPTGVNGIWIPLVRVDWNLAWTVYFDYDKMLFKVSTATHSVTANSDTLIFPTWDGTLTNGQIAQLMQT